MADELRQRYQDDMHAAIVEVGRWSQRSGQLEGERDAMAIAYQKLGAVLRVNMLRWVPDTSHDEIDAAIDACLGPVARRVLRDDHIPDAGKMVEPPGVKDCLTTELERLRAEVASLRAALGQQPAAEGAEPVGCPIPGMCAAVAAHAASYRAGAEAMREAIIDLVENTPCPGEAAETETGHRYAAGYRDASNAARDELNRLLAASRALPIPSREGEG